MAQEPPHPQPFGCGACFQGDAVDVWKRRPFRSLVSLVDDSHFGIDLMICPACDQRCVKIFTEFIDWQGGDDAQYWYVIPLTADEADELAAQGENVRPERIEAISTGRIVLQVDFPTGKEKRIHWSAGPVIITPGW